MDKQNALGLKSVPRAIGTPASIILRTGGGTSLSMYAVVGNITAMDPAFAMASIPLSFTFSK